MIACNCQSTGHDASCPNNVQGVYDGTGQKVVPLAPEPSSSAKTMMENLLKFSPPAWDMGARDMIRWLAQTVHQAYHNDDGPNGHGTCEECSKDICSSVRRFLVGGLTPKFTAVVAEAVAEERILSDQQIDAIEKRVKETPEGQPLPDFGGAPVLALIREVRRFRNR